MSHRAIKIVAILLFLVASSAIAQQASPQTDPLLTAQTFAVGERIQGFDRTPGTGQDAIKRPYEPEVQTANSMETGLGIYRGVVFGNFLKTYGKQQIICDFGKRGVWLYDGTWRQLSAADPDWIIGTWRTDTLGPDYQYGVRLVGDFGDMGLWVWEYKGVYNGLWTQLSGANAVWGFIAGGSRVFVNFGALGLWHYRTSWARGFALEPCHGLNSQVHDSRDSTFNFPGIGVWSIISDGTQIRQLTATVTLEDDHASGKFTNPSYDEDLVMDFATLGLWLLKAGTNSYWLQISTDDVNRLKPARLNSAYPGLVILDNFKPGIYYWHYYDSFPGKEVQICTTNPDPFGFCEPFDFNQDYPLNDDELAVDFGELGLWAYEANGGTWTQLSSQNPAFMVAGDYWGDGTDTALAVSFGTRGLWLYDGKFHVWTKLSGFAPDFGAL
jgi:hypothetical protein